MKSAKRVVRGSAKAAKKFIEPLGGKLTPASGAWLEKGDARVRGFFRVETKCPPTAKYRFTLKEWAKVRDAAIRANEIPVFHVVLAHEVVVVLAEKDYSGLGGDSKYIHLTEDRAPAASYAWDVHTWIGVLVFSKTARFTLYEPAGYAHPFRALTTAEFTLLAKRHIK